MYKGTKIIAALTAATVLTIGGVALARPGGHGQGGPQRLLKLVQKLDLTEAQQNLLDDLRVEGMKNHRANRAKRMETMRAIADEVEKPQADLARLEALADQHAEVMRQNLHTRIKGFAKLHQTMTPKQKQDLANQLRRMEKRVKKFTRE